jgi:hypothetical protein
MAARSVTGNAIQVYSGIRSCNRSRDYPVEKWPLNLCGWDMTVGLDSRELVVGATNEGSPGEVVER